MKVAKRLGLFVALALVMTGCGTGSTPTAQESEQEQADVLAIVEPDKEAEPNAQEQTEKEDQSVANGVQQAATGEKQATQSGSDQEPVKSADSSSAATSSDKSSPANPAPAPAPTQPQQALQTDSALHLAITENFGRHAVLDTSASFTSGQTVMDVLMSKVEVETGYSGSFVNGINGTNSGYTDKSVFTRKKRDWFFYQNGSIGAVGADSVQAGAGDHIWWDFHDWSGSGNNTSCVIAAYPHPFTSGYNGVRPGTVIYYTGNHADDAGRLAAGLQALGAGQVRTASYDDGAAGNPSTNAIVLGTWTEAGNQSAVQTAFSSPTKTGVYASYGDGAFHVLNQQGKKSGSTGQGVIVATGQGSGDTTPLWLVLGTTEEALDAAIDTMVSAPQKLKGKVGLVLNGHEAMGVPVIE